MPTIRIEHKDFGDDTGAILIAEHYQHTFELAYKYWRARNRLFAAMLAMLGFTALISVRSKASSLLVIGLANALGIEGDRSQMAVLQDSLPIAMVNGALLAIVAMLIFLIYQRTRYLKMLYSYLESLESEIRRLLGIPGGSPAFAREGQLYRRHSGVLQSRLLGATYVACSGVAIAAVVSLRLYQDIQSGSFASFFVELFFGSLAMLFFLGYARETIIR